MSDISLINQTNILYFSNRIAVQSSTIGTQQPSLKRQMELALRAVYYLFMSICIIVARRVQATTIQTRTHLNQTYRTATNYILRLRPVRIHRTVQHRI